MLYRSYIIKRGRVPCVSIALTVFLSCLHVTGGEQIRGDAVTAMIRDLRNPRSCVAASAKVKKQRKAAATAIAALLKQYASDDTERRPSAEVVANAVKLAGDIRCAEVVEELCALLDFVHVDSTSDGGSDVPFEQNFIVLPALQSIGKPAEPCLIRVLTRETASSLKAQLARRALALINQGRAAHVIEQAIADHPDTEEVLRSQINAPR